MRAQLRGETAAGRGTAVGSISSDARGILVVVRNIHGKRSSMLAIDSSLAERTRTASPDVMILTETMCADDTCDAPVGYRNLARTRASRIHHLGRPSGGTVAYVHEDLRLPVVALKVGRLALIDCLAIQVGADEKGRGTVVVAFYRSTGLDLVGTSEYFRKLGDLCTILARQGHRVVLAGDANAHLQGDPHTGGKCDAEGQMWLQAVASARLVRALPQLRQDDTPCTFFLMTEESYAASSSYPQDSGRATIDLVADGVGSAQSLIRFCLDTSHHWRTDHAGLCLYLHTYFTDLPKAFSPRSLKIRPSMAAGDALSLEYQARAEPVLRSWYDHVWSKEFQWHDPNFVDCEIERVNSTIIGVMDRVNPARLFRAGNGLSAERRRWIAAWKDGWSREGRDFNARTP
jgi:hypothetical protein